jgi:type IV pilus assembly protein PilF
LKRWLMVVLIGLAGCAEQQAQPYSAGETSARERARVHTELGAGYFAQNQMAIALEEFTEAIRIDGNYAMAYNGLGLVYGALREDAKADSNFKRSLQIEPNNSESRNNYGSFLCSRNRIDESIVQFTEAVKNPLYATPGVAYMNAGICALKKKDEKSAEIYLGKALQAQPLLQTAAYQLATIQFNRGQVGIARNTLKNALVNNPGPDTLWLGIRIERILGDRDAEASYALLLRKKYPNSEQTKALLSGQTAQ